MTETLAGMSPTKAVDLLKVPSLAEAAVAGVRSAAVLDDGLVLVVDVVELSAEDLAMARELSGRPVPVAWR